MANEIWQGGNGQEGVNWNVSGNWVSGVVPATGDAVSIPSGTPLADLEGATTTIGSLTVDSGASADLTGDMTITGDFVDNGGAGLDYQQLVEFGGSTLTVDGTLSTTNGGSPFAIGNRFQTAPTTVIVGALTNTGGIDIAGNAGVALAQLDVETAAGFGGMPGVLTGNVALGIGIAGGGGSGDALLDFEGGGLIDTIAGGLSLYGEAFVASGDATTSDSALAGPLTIASGGSLSLQGGASFTTQSLTADSGVGIDSAIESTGGSGLTITGTLTEANAGAGFAVGNEDQTAPSTVFAGSITNTGSIEIGGNSGGSSQAPVLAQIDVGSTAGFGGMAGVLTGDISLGMGIGGGGGQGDALLDFEGGGLINTIENGTLALTGPLAFVASGDATTTDSALAGPLTIAASGGLNLQAGATVATGALDDAGNISVDTAFLGTGGSSLTVDGLLTVSGNLTVGRSAMVGAGPLVTATGGLDNTGTISITGDTMAQLAGVLDVGGAAGFGTTGVLTGTVNLTGQSLLDFASGGITSTALNSNLFIDGTAAFLASGSAATGNSALTGLASVDGIFTLQDGATLTTNTGLSIANGSSFAGVNVDNSGAGGSTLNIGGVVTLNSFGGLTVGNSSITIATAVTASGLDFAGNTNTSITLNGGRSQYSGTAQSTLTVASFVGFGTDGVLAGGDVSLIGDALLDFTLGGQLTTTDFGTSLSLDGSNAYLASGNSTGSNSALTGLTTMGGNLDLLDGAVVAVSGSLTIGNGTNGADVQLTSGAALTVAQGLSLVGSQDSLSIQSASVSASSLANAAGITVSQGGTLTIDGDATNSGSITVGTDGNFVIDGALSGTGTLSVAGTVDVAGSTNSATILSGGVENVLSGGTAAGTVLSGGFLVVSSGGQVTGPVSAGSGGGTVELVDGGSVVAGNSGLTISAGFGSDTVNALVGGDTVEGGSGTALVFGASGDVVEDGSGQAFMTLSGGANPTIFALSGGTALLYAGADDTLVGGGGTAVAIGAAGDDFVLGAGNDTVDLIPAGETLTFGSGSAIVYGGPGDTIGDAAGTVVTFTSGSNAIVLAGSGDSVLLYSGPGDTIAAGNAASTVIGATGDDIMLGTGADTVNAFPANEVVELGAGPNETVYGGAGDTIEAAGGAALVTFVGGSEGIVFAETAGQDQLYSGPGDTLLIGAGTLNVIGAANNVLTLGSGTDTVNALPPNEAVTLGTGNATVFGGDGDTIGDAAGRVVVLTGGNSAIVVEAAGAAVTVNDGDGDTITAGNASATIAGAQNSSIVMGAASDTVTGANGDTVTAGAGSDSIDLGASHSAAEFLAPGSGTDTSANDTVVNFNQATGDSILETGTAETNTIASAQSSGGNTTITLSDGSTVTLVGVTTINSSFFS